MPKKVLNLLASKFTECTVFNWIKYKNKRSTRGLSLNLFFSRSKIDGCYKFGGERPAQWVWDIEDGGNDPAYELVGLENIHN